MDVAGPGRPAGSVWTMSFPLATTTVADAGDVAGGNALSL